MIHSPRRSIEVSTSAETEERGRLQEDDLATRQRFPRRQPTNQKDRSHGY